MRNILLLVSLVSALLADCPLKKGDQPSGPGTSAACEYLPENQKAFASLLSATHQQIFCGQFTNEQRAKAMELSSTGLTPDEAIEQVLTESRGTAPTAPPAGKKKHKGLTIIK
ncbi:MAG: hypothetical protein SNF33_03025 [Candidatus Algichlamydia australiensis]|nr:hypothetical protein [Chlamydiales bacterium]